jgi:GNAT superfamily N-acetyltransferase
VTSIEVRRAELGESTEITDLLAAAVGDKGRRLDEALRRYRDDPDVTLLIAVADNHVLGVAGYTNGESHVTVLHIATAQSVRHRGVGRRLLGAVIRAAPDGFRVNAETDADAVGFYLANGFVATSLGQKYPGVQRFIVEYGIKPA